jgi:hypothetical protein
MCIDNLGPDHEATLQAIFEEPTRPDIQWQELLDLLKVLGATTRPESDRVLVFIAGKENSRLGVFHRRQRQRCATTSTVEDIRYLLMYVGIEP